MLAAMLLLAVMNYMLIHNSNEMAGSALVIAGQVVLSILALLTMGFRFYFVGKQGDVDEES